MLNIKIKIYLCVTVTFSVRDVYLTLTEVVSSVRDRNLQSLKCPGWDFTLCGFSAQLFLINFKREKEIKAGEGMNVYSYYNIRDDRNLFHGHRIILSKL